MGIFSKIKKGMGLGTITFELVVPSSVSGGSGSLEGDIVVTAKSAQQVKDVEVTFQRVITWDEPQTTYNSTTKQNEEIWVGRSQTQDLGRFVDKSGFSLGSGESKTIHFAISFPPIAPQQVQSSGWDVLDTVTDIALGSSFGSSQRNQRVKYVVTGDADLEDVAFDKGDSKDIAIV